MNPTQAQQFLQTLINEKRDEGTALETALSVLNGTFLPDITALAQAQSDADTQRTKAAQLSDEKEQALGDQRDAYEAVIRDKDTRIAELENQLNPAKQGDGSAEAAQAVTL